MFDSLYVTCTCGGEVEFQSKASDCVLATYTVDNVPPAIAGDLDGSAKQCPACGKVIRIKTETRLWVRYE